MSRLKPSTFFCCLSVSRTVIVLSEAPYAWRLRHVRRQRTAQIAQQVRAFPISSAQATVLMLSFEIGFILNITETECAGTERPVRLAIYPLALMETLKLCKPPELSLDKFNKMI